MNKDRTEFRACFRDRQLPNETQCPVFENMQPVTMGDTLLRLREFFQRPGPSPFRGLWIGWTEEQRRRRLPLLVNNCRFLLLPHKTFPNLGSRSLRLALDRLSADWQARYGHPVVLVETFVDPEQFCGTVYSANGWQ